MGYKAYYSCYLMPRKDDELLEPGTELDSVYFDYVNVELNGEEIAFDVEDADGFSTIIDDDGGLKMEGSFSFECDEELEFDDSFNITPIGMQFGLYLGDDELEYETDDMVLSFWIDGELKEFYAE